MTTSTCSAIATPLSSDRRGFLSQLAILPLVGGSLTLIGNPRRVAEPVTMQMLQAYKTWLHYEHRALSWEIAARPEIASYYGGTQTERFLRHVQPMIQLIDVGEADDFHHFDGAKPPSGRAALVLSAVGCNWRDDRRRSRRA